MKTTHLWPRLTLAAATTAGLLAALPAAHAQSSANSNVTVYGIVDAGIEYRTQNNAAGKSQVRVNSGGLNTSRLGFKGNEDMGNGLSAQFNLESEVVLDTGASASAFFGRQAWVGLEQKGLGSVALGRMSTVVYDFTIGHDFMGYAPQYSWVTGTASVPASGFTSRISNGIRYLGKYDNFKLGVNLGLGEMASSFNANTNRGVSLGYDAGPLSAQISYDDGRSAATDTASASTRNRSVVVSGTYAFEGFKVFAGVRDTKRSPVGAITASNPRFISDLYWLGLSAPVSTNVTAFGGVYYENKHGTDADPMMLAGKVHYNLSKRTWLYATAAVATSGSDGNKHTLTGVFRDQTPVDSHQSGLGIGIQHRF